MKVVTCTICPIEDGKGFVADMQADDGAGNVVAIPGNQYPLVLYPGSGAGEEAEGVGWRVGESGCRGFGWGDVGPIQQHHVLHRVNS
jgi:hypothetical protein